LVDTLGLMLTAVVHPASVQDRDGAVLVLDEYTRRLFPFLEKIFADSAYGGPKLADAIAAAGWTIEVVKRRDGQKGFEVLPRRWVVERTIAWLNRCRRLAKDYENLNRMALAFVRLASIRLMLRRITRYCVPA
jgi:putative transposase